MLAKRHDLQKMAAFNLGVAEAVTYKKKARDLDFHVRSLVKKNNCPETALICLWTCENLTFLSIFSRNPIFSKSVLSLPHESWSSESMQQIWLDRYSFVPELSLLPHTKTHFRRLITQYNTCIWYIYMILLTFCDTWFEGHCQGHCETEEESRRGILGETGTGSASRRVSWSWAVYL